MFLVLQHSSYAADAAIHDLVARAMFLGAAVFNTIVYFWSVSVRYKGKT